MLNLINKRTEFVSNYFIQCDLDASINSQLIIVWSTAWSLISHYRYSKEIQVRCS